MCIAATSCTSGRIPETTDPIDLTERMKQSLVYLEISKITYDMSQPWKQTAISTNSGSGCAVGPYEILTTAENVANATLIKIRRYEDNVYLEATVKAVDYEYNLCLLEIDKDAAQTPLTPLSFKESYPKNKQLTAYWLSSGDHLTTARSTLDRAEMDRSSLSFANVLTFFLTNASRPFGDGQVCYYKKDPIGIAAWGTESDAGLIPAETINRFVKSYEEGAYTRFAAAGFRASTMLDPAMREYLKVPDDIQYGIYVNAVYTIGTGSKDLKQGDVILSIDGQQLDSYGRYEHPDYNRISFYHIIFKTPDGTNITFEIVRDGTIMTLNIKAKHIESDNMLVPYYLYGKQPEYKVIGGYIFQKLTRDYMGLWGGSRSVSSPPHLQHYLRDHAFNPSSEREDIVILSYVLPAPINLGYQQLSQLVVDSVNGTKITSMKHFAETIDNISSDSIEITFEMESPTLIIPKSESIAADYQIAQLYGIPKLMHLEE